MGDTPKKTEKPWKTGAGNGLCAAVEGRGRRGLRTAAG